MWNSALQAIHCSPLNAFAKGVLFAVPGTYPEQPWKCWFRKGDPCNFQDEARRFDQWVNKLEGAANLEKSGVDFTKMEGQKKGENYYRIRLGDWRVGIEYIHPKVIVIRILARGQVYKHFPPA